MSGHRVRSDLGGESVEMVSSTPGELLDARRFWGVEYVLNSAGAESRKVVEPSQSNQRMQLVSGTVGGTILVNAPTGQDFNGAGGNQLQFAAAGEWVVLESFNIEGTYEWRVVAKDSAVEITN